ncbi:MAG TPA: pyridoxal-phosphate dependent enzyme [Candidatus Limnocylindrales bacterium]
MTVADGRPASPIAAAGGGRQADLATWLACAGCGWRPPLDRPIALRCEAALPGDGIDHLLRRHLDPARLAFPTDDDPQPFVRFRTLSLAYHVARAAGWSDERYVALVKRLDEAVAAVDGHGFGTTPFGRADALSSALGFAPRGGVFVKDETGNVAGSHKARHLFGTLLGVEIAETVAREAGAAAATAGRPLAIASCGNAALAAAVVARAAGRDLDVYIPPDAEPAVVARLRDLGARLTVCERTPGEAGDPTYRRLLQAIAGGAVPFTCQGDLNGLAVEAGETLGLELVADVIRRADHLDRLVVQVGGGALASAAIGAFLDARLLGLDLPLPRLHAVQTAGAFPLVRAYERLAARLLGLAEDRDVADDALEIAGETDPPEAPRPSAAAHPDLARADLLRALAASPAGRHERTRAARHRAAFMWPWETEPRSIAHGILDDETYDWLAVLEGLLASGGYPLVVDEPTLVQANAIALRSTPSPVDATGTAGLAGLLQLVERGAVGPAERVAVLFTGARRASVDAPATPSTHRVPTVTVTAAARGPRT